MPPDAVVAKHALKTEPWHSACVCVCVCGGGGIGSWLLKKGQLWGLGGEGVGGEKGGGGVQCWGGGDLQARKLAAYYEEPSAAPEFACSHSDCSAGWHQCTNCMHGSAMCLPLRFLVLG